MSTTAAAAETWTATGSLNFARRAHTATLLSDGTVLAAAGRTSSAATSAELYTPATKEWSPTGSLAVPRYYHSETLLADGQVLAAGGLTRGTGTFDFVSVSSAELYDPASRLWTPTGSMATPRDSHTDTRLTNGRVLVAGGITNFPLGGLDSAELYDPATRTWLPTGSMANARANHTETLLPNGKVLVAGGETDVNGTSLASAEVYDPATGTWSVTGSLAGARKMHTATLLPNGKVLVAGGRGGTNSLEPLATAELYDPATGSWSSTGELGDARFDHTATFVDGEVLVVGGGDDPTAERYDPAAGQWNSAGSLATARSEHTTTLLPDGSVLVAGGCGEPCPLGSSELRLAAVPPAADLSITTADSPDPVQTGQELTYTLSVLNAGPQAAQGVTVRDELPVGVELVSVSPGCSTVARVVTCDIGVLVSGTAALQRQITVRPSEANAALSNTATVQSGIGDPQSANNTSTTATDVRPPDTGGAGTGGAGTGGAGTGGAGSGGDGGAPAVNGSAGSGGSTTSKPSSLARCRDQTRPRSSVSKRSMVSRRRIALSGRTSDRECSSEGRIIRTQRRLARVEVSFSTKSRGQCRFLTTSGSLNGPGSCGDPVFVRARVVSFNRSAAKSTWQLAKGVRLVRGTYTVTVRGVDRDGNVEVADRSSNRASFQVR